MPPRPIRSPDSTKNGMASSVGSAIWVAIFWTERSNLRASWEATTSRGSRTMRTMGASGQPYRFWRPALRPGALRERAEAALERVGLSDHAATRTGELSHGQRRQLEVAVALTLSPMLSSKVLKPYGKQGRFEEWVEHWFGRLADRYQRFLHGALDYLPVTMLFAATVLVSIVFMFITSKNELAPVEDQSILFFQATAPQTATIEYNEAYTRQIVDAFETVPEYHESFFLLGRGEPTTTFGGFKMEPPSKRPRSQMDVQPEVQAKLQNIAGFQTAVFPRPSLPGSGGGLPVQFVMTSDASYQELDQLADQFIGRAMGSGQFRFLMKELQYARPRTTLVIDRDRAGDLGISMQDIGRNLATLLDKRDLQPAFRKTFETIGMAKVATSGEEARDRKFLRPFDKVEINREQQLWTAKRMAIAMAEEGYRPPMPKTFKLPGEEGLATLKMMLHNMKLTHWISSHDEKIATHLGRILTGGDTTINDPVSEQTILDLEREAFLSLCGEPKTQDRIKYMLVNNKPLRN